MSWIFGFNGTSLSPALRERLVALHDDPLHSSEGRTHYVATGGLPETCHVGVLPEAPEGGWAVVGLGLRRHEDHCSFLDTDAWGTLLNQPAPEVAGLDGHFVALRWQAGRVEAFTDSLGARTLYLTSLPEGIAFSTRLDWLATLRGGVAIRFEAFGAHWLTFNQLSTTFLAHDIRRLGPGGHALCTGQHLDVNEHPWTPEIAETDRQGEAFARTLSALVHPWTPARRALTLGLSGGLDSRLLLAIRLQDTPIVQTHVFGPEDHPDVRIARRLAQQEGLRQYHFDEPIPDVDTCLDLLRSQVAQTQAVSAASSVLGLRYYGDLYAQRLVMIDGGLGEVARRQFMNRLLRRGRAALRSGDPAAILPYLRVPRAEIFNPEVLATMERGAQQQIAALWQALPDPRTIGEENFLDLLGIQTRLPNFFGFEQNRLDGVIQNYMPFAQPSLLRALFQMPLSLRRNGRLFRHLIRSQRVSLARYPLVKGGVTYPFQLPTAPAYVWTKLKTRLGQGYTDTARLRFLETLKPFALDAVQSQAVRTYPAYDYARLTRLVEEFYQGRSDLASEVDWWLAFERWRRTLGSV